MAGASEPGTPTGELELALSRVVHWASRPDIRREVIVRAGVNITPTGAWVLGRIMEHGPLRLSDLASSLGVEKASMTPRVQQLERVGLVRRNPDPSDGRACLLEISREGRRVLARLHLARQQLLEDILADWPEHVRAAVASALGSLAEQLSRAPHGAALARSLAGRRSVRPASSSANSSTWRASSSPTSAKNLPGSSIC
ncbi:MAG: MarR family winged helix-turn-helix transcriptional regulator [Streptosporangiaceae bacterium]